MRPHRAALLVFAIVLYAILPAAAQRIVPSGEELAALLESGEFAGLEAVAKTLREERPLSAEGYWASELFYGRLSEIVQQRGSSPERAIASWRAAEPGAQSWRIVLARAYVDAAAPPPNRMSEGFDLSRQERRPLERGWDLVEFCRRAPDTDPAIYPTAIRLAWWLDKDREISDRGFENMGDSIRRLGDFNRDIGLLDDLVEEAESVSPGYVPVYEARIDTLMPSAGASIGDLEDFVARMSEKHGDTVYARLVVYTLGQTAFRGFMENFVFSWPRTRSGFEALVRRYPGSRTLNNYYALMACLYMDRETAAARLAELGDNYDRRLWGETQPAFLAWANQQAPYPLAP